MDRVNPSSPSTPKPHRQADELHMENTLLRSRLEDLLEHAHRNQNIMARHQNFDLKMIGSNNFEELIACIFSDLAETSELDIVTLILIDQRDYLQQMLTNLKIDLSNFPHLHFIRSESDLQKQIQLCGKPTLGLYQPQSHISLFASHPKKPASVAIIPMWRQGRLIGCLNLGSFRPDRFMSTMATDFIERLACIIAICLENVVNNQRLTYIGLTDPLTNVSNRRYVEQRALEEIARAQRQQYGIGCLYLDIDFFKKINDQYGHQGGDDVLCEVAKRIKAELRLSDTLGRFGGEEFVVLLINASLQESVLVAERIRKSIEEQAFILTDTRNCNTTISIGLSIIDHNNNAGPVTSLARDMLLRADRALYKAKNEGRNRYAISS